MTESPAAIGTRPMKPAVTKVSTTGWSDEAQKASATNAGRGTTAITSHRSCLRSVPRDLPNRTTRDTAARTSPSAVRAASVVRTTRSAGSHESGRAHGLRTEAMAASSSGPGQKSTVAYASVPTTTVKVAARRHRGVSAEPVGVRCRIRATSTNHAMKMPPPSTAASSAAGTLPGRATAPYLP